MRNVGEVREREGGGYEILIATTSDGWEEWEGLASFMVRSSTLELPNGAPLVGLSTREALLAEGWIAPDQELTEFVCDVYSARAGVRCTLRLGHEGLHHRPGFTWNADAGY